MDEQSARWQLPLLQVGQAQKEVTHNEALALIEVTLQAVVVAAGVNDPPDEPALGESWIVGQAPTGAWSGEAAALACWTTGGWRFVAACEGLTAWDAPQHIAWRYVDGAWEQGRLRAQALSIGGVQVVGAQQPAIAAVSGGGTIDAPARAVLDQILQALRTHGLIAT